VGEWDLILSLAVFHLVSVLNQDPNGSKIFSSTFYLGGVYASL